MNAFSVTAKSTSAKSLVTDCKPDDIKNVTSGFTFSFHVETSTKTSI